MEREEINAVSEQVIGAVFEVANTLGSGFLEKVYERALVRELGMRGISVSTQVAVAVRYKGYPVGDYLADVLVDGRVLVELKCVERLGNEHTAQCMNYLKASGLSVCLLVNFQRPKAEWKRVVLGF